MEQKINSLDLLSFVAAMSQSDGDSFVAGYALGVAVAEANMEAATWSVDDLGLGGKTGLILRERGVDYAGFFAKQAALV